GINGLKGVRLNKAIQICRTFQGCTVEIEYPPDVRRVGGNPSLFSPGNPARFAKFRLRLEGRWRQNAVQSCQGYTTHPCRGKYLPACYVIILCHCYLSLPMAYHVAMADLCHTSQGPQGRLWGHM